MSDFIKDIKENYLKMEREIVTQLNYNVSNHRLTAGTYREEIWADFFRRIVPKKFNIARSVFIIDSNENISKEVDIAIYDEQYTPYIFNYGLIKFIPIEAVAAVVQCKSRALDKENLLNWIKSINKLQTSNDSIVRLAGYIHVGRESSCKATQTATSPIKVLCHIPTDETSKDNICDKERFNIVIEAYENSKLSEEQNQSSTEYNGNLKINFSDKNLFDVLKNYNHADKEDANKEDNAEKQEKNKKCNEQVDEESVNSTLGKKESVNPTLEKKEIEQYKVKDEIREYTLLSFIFQFNQMLMMINNPMFFPHKAYVDMFNKNV